MHVSSWLSVCGREVRLLQLHHFFFKVTSWGWAGCFVSFGTPRSLFTVSVWKEYLFKLTSLHGYHSGDLFFFAILESLPHVGHSFAFHGPQPTPALTLLRSISSPPLWTPPLLICTTLDAAPTESTLSQWNPDRHAALSLWVKRKQLLAVARQRQMWLIPRPRPSSTDTNPLNKQQSVY